MVLTALIIVVFSLAACGGGDTGGGGGGATQTVTIKETKGANGDVYMADPASITVNKGDTVKFTNTSDETQDFDQADAGTPSKSGVDFKMDINQSTTATFKTAGTFTLKSELPNQKNAPGATLMVTVK